MALGLTVLLWILFVLFSNGIAALDWNLLTKDTPAPGTEGGGLRNAIVGSLLMAGVGTLIGTPIGILAGTYLAEFGQRGWLAPATRFLNDVLLSAPSIAIGLFVYTVYVKQVGHFSAMAGAVALSLIVIPVVVRTTDDMLKLVPGSLREAAMALGCPTWKMIVLITYRAASADDKLAAAQLAITVGDSEAARRLGFPRNSIATWRAMLVEAQADKALNSEEKLAVYGDKRKRNNTEKMLALDDLLIAFFLSLRSEVRHEVVFGAYFNLFVFVATRVGQPCNDPHAGQGALGEAVPRPC
jgi:phosphate transport system permease protein